MYYYDTHAPQFKANNFSVNTFLDDKCKMFKLLIKSANFSFA